MRELPAGPRASLRSPGLVLRVGLSAVVFTALFLVSWLVYMPVMALVAAPFTLLVCTLAGAAPSAPLNSIASVLLAGGLAGATVTAVFRVLLRRARARAARAAAVQSTGNARA